MRNKWTLPQHDPDQLRGLADALRISEITAKLLVNRGKTDVAEARKFLEPSLTHLSAPCESALLCAAASFLSDAISRGKRITVFGDYDADGICATALLLDCFALAGADADFYIPSRFDEGYGLSVQSVEELAARGTDVVVTVDCGVNALEEAELARRRGLELVITDHHEPDPQVADAAFVLNPKLAGSGVGYENLSGAGVAFKLIWALAEGLSPGESVSEAFKDFLLEAVALVAIGTIADVVPLLSENRVLASFGLKSIPHCAKPGLRCLREVARVSGNALSARDVAFKLAPRLNAAGRMGDAGVAVEMLTTCDGERARELARQLEEQNRARRRAQETAMQEAEQILEASPEALESPCIVLSSTEWHPGVVGLVASKLAEKFWRPAFVFTEDEGRARGSARSVPGFSLFEAVSSCQDVIERYGGHQRAAGLELRLEKLPEFIERINSVAAQMMGEKRPQPELNVEAEVQLSHLSPALVAETNRLAPFGQANPAPVFAASNLRLAGNPQLVGRASNHLAFLVRQEETTLRAIGFGKASHLEELQERHAEPLALAFSPGIDTYNDRNAVQLEVRDIQWESDRLIERQPPTA